MLCSDSADCVTCFNLTSRWYSFIRRLTILPLSPMYTCPQEQDIFYIPAELTGGLWSLGFLKICLIFLGDLKIVRMLCLFNILPIWSVVLLTWENGHIGSSRLYQRHWETVVLFVCLLIVLIMSFLSYLFFCKIVFKWLNSVCRCSLSEIPFHTNPNKRNTKHNKGLTWSPLSDLIPLIEHCLTTTYFSY